MGPDLSSAALNCPGVRHWWGLSQEGQTEPCVFWQHLHLHPTSHHQCPQLHHQRPHLPCSWDLEH